MHRQTKRKARPKKGNKVLMTHALVPVNIFDPETLPCGELAQLCRKETEFPEVPKSFRPEERSELIYYAVHRRVG